MDRTYTEDLLNALLRRPENSDQLVEELNWYMSDLKSGELSESDADYIQALADRLGVVVRSADFSDTGSGEGTFLERVRAIARATMDSRRPAESGDETERLEPLSARLDLLADRLEQEVLKDAHADGAFPLPVGHIAVTLMQGDDTPAIFMDGNEQAVKTTPGYARLEQKCNTLGLNLTLKKHCRHVDEGQPAMEPDAPAPILYHADVVISGWV